MTSYAALDRLATRQRGLLTYQQLIEAGINRRSINWRRTTGLLVPVRRGVFRWCGSNMDWATMAMAAVLEAGPGAVVSHHSAAVLWDLMAPGDLAGIDLELSAPRQVRIEGVTAHRRSLGRHDTTHRRRVPVTTIERTLADLAVTATPATLGRLVDEALRRRLTTTERLAAANRRLARRPPAWRTVLAERGAGYDPGANDWEQRMDRLWDQAGLPPAVRQYRLRTGGRTLVIDRAVVDLRIAVEWNGREYHGTRSGFDGDSARRSLLVRAGWLPLDFTTRTSPAELVQTVRAAVAARLTATPPQATAPTDGPPGS